MSKLIAMRMSEELLNRIDAKTENRSALIVAAVEAYLGESSKQMIIEPSAKVSRARPRIDRKVLKATEPAEPEQVVRCQECFAPAGIHQRFCSKK